MEIKEKSPVDSSSVAGVPTSIHSNIPKNFAWEAYNGIFNICTYFYE
jgi:hypothetical protein